MFTFYCIKITISEMCISCNKYFCITIPNSIKIFTEIIYYLDTFFICKSATFFAEVILAINYNKYSFQCNLGSCVIPSFLITSCSGSPSKSISYSGQKHGIPTIFMILNLFAWNFWLIT